MNFIGAYFTNEKIWNLIVNIRIGLQDKRSKFHADREISTHRKTYFHQRKNYKGDDYLNKITPPRRQWSNPGSGTRQKLQSTKARNKFRLNVTFKKAAKNPDPPKWYNEFISFCDYIRLKVEDISNIGFSSPQIIPIPKKTKV